LNFFTSCFHYVQLDPGTRVQVNGSMACGVNAHPKSDSKWKHLPSKLDPSISNEPSNRSAPQLLGLYRVPSSLQSFDHAESIAAFLPAEGLPGFSGFRVEVVEW